ncbi:MAG TPA: hypothetical protein VKU02_29440, partial [Gemmataceae bacterium]|nr:hypothetical protein [Gemmataceae bacterium]
MPNESVVSNGLLMEPARAQVPEPGLEPAPEAVEPVRAAAGVRLRREQHRARQPLPSKPTRVAAETQG